ncbi:MAG: hypothetical protein ACTSUE_16755 [Promethearchaeota archaeon]
MKRYVYAMMWPDGSVLDTFTSPLDYEELTRFQLNTNQFCDSSLFECCDIEQEEVVVVVAKEKAKTMGQEQRTPEKEIKEGSLNHHLSTNVKKTVKKKRRRRKKKRRRRKKKEQRGWELHPLSECGERRKRLFRNKYCCIVGCYREVTNRSQKSLKMKHTLDTQCGDSICHKCYFADLYRWKKMKNNEGVRRRTQTLTEEQ